MEERESRLEYRTKMTAENGIMAFAQVGGNSITNKLVIFGNFRGGCNDCMVASRSN